jgi:hypothetical protein
MAVDLADPVMHQDVRRARRHRAAPRADDRLRRERTLDALVLEPLVEEVAALIVNRRTGLVHVAPAPARNRPAVAAHLGRSRRFMFGGTTNSRSLSRPRDVFEVAVERDVRLRVVPAERADRRRVAVDIAPTA